MKLAALLLLITLSACANPPRASVRTSADADMDVIVAQATLDEAEVAQQATRQAVENQQATADVMARITVSETAVAKTATVAWRVTDEARVGATATRFEFNREQIELEAYSSLTISKTVATQEAIHWEMQRNQNNAELGKYGRIVFVTICLVLFLFLGFALINAINVKTNSITVCDKYGNPITVGGVMVDYDEDEPEEEKPIQITGRVLGVRTRRSQTVPVEEFRKPFDLADHNGEHVHRFDGNALDNMEANVENGDLGFRRGTSGENLGLDELAGIRGGDKYSPVLSAMKHHGYLESVGLASKWTELGMRKVLGIGGTNNLTNNLE